MTDAAKIEFSFNAEFVIFLLSHYNTGLWTNSQESCNWNQNQNIKNPEFMWVKELGV